MRRSTQTSWLQRRERRLTRYSTGPAFGRPVNSNVRCQKMVEQSEYSIEPESVELRRRSLRSQSRSSCQVENARHSNAWHVRGAARRAHEAGPSVRWRPARVQFSAKQNNAMHFSPSAPCGSSSEARRKGSQWRFLNVLALAMHCGFIAKATGSAGRCFPNGGSEDRSTVLRQQMRLLGRNGI